jgi:hypothetical protein
VLDAEEFAAVVAVVWELDGAVCDAESLNETGSLREAANEAKGVNNNV